MRQPCRGATRLSLASPDPSTSRSRSTSASTRTQPPTTEHPPPITRGPFPQDRWSAIKRNHVPSTGSVVAAEGAPHRFVPSAAAATGRMRQGITAHRCARPGLSVAEGPQPPQAATGCSHGRQSVGGWRRVSASPRRGRHGRALAGGRSCRPLRGLAQEATLEPTGFRPWLLECRPAPAGLNDAPPHMNIPDDRNWGAVPAASLFCPGTGRRSAVGRRRGGQEALWQAGARHTHGPTPTRAPVPAPGPTRRKAPIPTATPAPTAPAPLRRAVRRPIHRWRAAPPSRPARGPHPVAPGPASEPPAPPGR